MRFYIVYKVDDVVEETTFWAIDIDMAESYIKEDFPTAEILEIRSIDN